LENWNENERLNVLLGVFREGACGKKNKTSAGMIETPETQEEILYVIEFF
jgi:hypothetical protein